MSEESKIVVIDCTEEKETKYISHRNCEHVIVPGCIYAYKDDINLRCVVSPQRNYVNDTVDYNVSICEHDIDLETWSPPDFIESLFESGMVDEIAKTKNIDRFHFINFLKQVYSHWETTYYENETYDNRVIVMLKTKGVDLVFTHPLDRSNNAGAIHILKCDVTDPVSLYTMLKYYVLDISPSYTSKIMNHIARVI